METSPERRRRKLTQLCHERGLKSVAERAGVSWQSLDQVIKGTLLPARKDGARMPRSLGNEAARKIEESEMLEAGWFDAVDLLPPESSNVTSAVIGTTRIPLLNQVQAGNWSEVTDPFQKGDASDWLVTDLKVSRSTFALEIKGDSMLPDFKPGDRIIVDPEVQPLPGDFVVAKNGEEEATFKKYRPRGVNESGDQVFELVPLNEDYPSMRSDLVHIRIIGTMVEHRKYRKR